MRNDNDQRSGSRTTVTRRDLLAGAVASGAAALLAGCGGGSLFNAGGGGGGGGLTQRAQTLTLNFDTAPVAVEDGQKVNYVVSYTGNGLQSAFWGTQDANGLPQSILQGLVWDTNADQGVRVTFDGRGLPATVLDLSSGAFVTCFWDADRAVFKFFQPSGQYIGGAAVSGAAPNFTVVQLADSVLVGLYVGDLANTTNGIFSIAVGGSSRGQAQSKAAGRRAAARPQARQSRDISAQLAPALTQLVKITGQGDYTPFAKALIGQLSSEYLQTGKSPTFALITQTALKNTGMSGLHLDDGLSIVRGILAAPVLQQAASDMLTRTNAGEDLAAKDTVRYQASSPGLTVYTANSDLPAPLPASDGTAVSGVMVSRDFGSIPVTGVIDASGNFTASGTAGGNIVTMTGQAAGTTVTGTWTIAQSSRGSRAGGGGSFNGNQQPIGQCQEQQNSGGQGTFTNTYDLQKCGHFPFTYDAFTIPDQLQVLNGGKIIFDTGGPVSGGQTVDLSVSGASTLVTVVVYASLQGTAWVYTVGCPQ